MSSVSRKNRRRPKSPVPPPLHAFFESALDAVLVVDDAGRCVEVNRAACELIGLPRLEILGRHVRDFSGPESDAPALASFRGRGRSSGISSFYRPDGTVREVEFAEAPDALPGLHLSILRDVTERRLAEKELERRVGALERIYDLANAVSRAASLEEIYQQALDALAGTLGADRGSVLLFDPDGVMRFKASRGVSAAYQKMVEGHSPWTPETTNPQPVLVEDVMTDASLAPLREFIVREGIRALGFIPLVDEGRLLGKLMIYYDAPHAFSPGEVRLAETVARQVAFVIARKRSEQAIRESEQSYRALFEANPVAMWLRDPQTLAFVAANDAAVRQYGYSREELLGLTDKDILAPEELERISDVRGGTGRNGAVDAGVREHRRKDGSSLWVELSVRDVVSSGRPFRLILANDVTERRRVDEEHRFLAEASALLGSSLDYETTLGALGQLAVPLLGDLCLIDLLDSQGTPVRVAAAHASAEMEAIPRRYPINPAAPLGVGHVARTGEAEFVPAVPGEMLEEAAWDREHARLLKMLVGSYICVPLKARGRTLGAMTLIRSPGHGGYDAKHLLLAQEVARRSSFAVDNARLFQEVRETSAQKSRFLSAVSHDLRTPASAIALLSSLIRKEATGGAASPTGLVERCQRLEIAASSFADLLSDLLEIGSFDSGQKKMRDEVFRLDDLVRDSLETCASAARRKALPIRVRWEMQSPAIRADRHEFGRVLTNLVSNAVKFTDSGVVKLEISRARNGDVEVRVRDTGTGIPAEHLPSLFSEFFQVRNAERDRSKGTGLGLAISRRIMHALGGSLKVESRLGVGSTFMATLPADRVLEPQLQERCNVPEGPDRASALPRIVVIDDDATSREALSVLLGDEGFHVRTASGGEEGLELVAAEPPDVLLLDMMMPGMDGLEVIRKIRRDENFEKLRIIALTGDVTRERLQNVLDAGADQFVPKPFRIPALLESVRAVLRMRS